MEESAQNSKVISGLQAVKLGKILSDYISRTTLVSRNKNTITDFILNKYL